MFDLVTFFNHDTFFVRIFMNPDKSAWSFFPGLYGPNYYNEFISFGRDDIALNVKTVARQRCKSATPSALYTNQSLCSVQTVYSNTIASFYIILFAYSSLHINLNLFIAFVPIDRKNSVLSVYLNVCHRGCVYTNIYLKSCL